MTDDEKLKYWEDWVKEYYPTSELVRVVPIENGLDVVVRLTGSVRCVTINTEVV